MTDRRILFLPVVYRLILAAISLCLILSGCQTAQEPTPVPTTEIPPTDTSIPPTETPVPPTPTPIPPTDTPLPPTPTPIPHPWTQKADLLLHVVAASAVTLDDKVYVISGAAPVGEVMADEHTIIQPSLLPVSIVQVYDVPGDFWSQVADIPTPRFYHATAVVDGMIYAFGGSPGANYVNAMASVEVYDPAADTWESRADMPVARIGHSTQVIDGKVWVFGGDLDCNCKVDVYDPATDMWEARDDMPRSHDQGASAYVGGMVYFFGGITRQGYVHEVDVYDPMTGQWSQVADMPIPRSRFGVCVIGDKIYILWGGTKTAQSPRNFITTAVDVYDTSTAEWTPSGDWQGALFPLNIRIPGIPAPSYNAAVASVGERLFVFGGNHHDKFIDSLNVWEYDTDF